MIGKRDLRVSTASSSSGRRYRLWAAKCKNAASDVYVYVDNYFEGHGPATAGKFSRVSVSIDPNPTALRSAFAFTQTFEPGGPYIISGGLI